MCVPHAGTWGSVLQCMDWGQVSWQQPCLTLHTQHLHSTITLTPELADTCYCRTCHVSALQHSSSFHFACVRWVLAGNASSPLLPNAISGGGVAAAAALWLQGACFEVQFVAAAAPSTSQLVDQNSGGALTVACSCAAALALLLLCWCSCAAVSDSFQHDPAESWCATLAGVPRVWLG